MVVEKYIGAIDQGTTGTRFMIFDHDSNLVGSHYREFPLHTCEHSQVPQVLQAPANKYWWQQSVSSNMGAWLNARRWKSWP